MIFNIQNGIPVTDGYSKQGLLLTKLSSYIPAIVDLPTPPLAEDTAITFFTPATGLFCGSPCCIRATMFGRGGPF